jgi:hypothetical protein
MSRLVFKESSEVPIENFNARVQEERSTSKNSSNNKSSYDLFDLNHDDQDVSQTNPPPKAQSTSVTQTSQSSAKPPSSTAERKNVFKSQTIKSTAPVSSRAKQTPKDLEIIDVSSDSESDNEEEKKKLVQQIPVKKVESNKLKKLEKEPIITTSAVTSPPNLAVSSFLTKFLSQKRLSINDVEPPPIEVSDDTYLRLFNEGFTKSNTKSAPKTPIDSEKPQEGITEEDVLRYSDFIVPNEGLLTDEIEADEVSIHDMNAANEEDEEDENESDFGVDELAFAPRVATMHLYNLPYDFSQEDLTVFLTNNGLQVKSVTVGGATDKKLTSNMPAGSASVEVLLEEGQSLHDCLNLINGKYCGRRPVRAQKAQSDNRKRFSLGRDSLSRYFENDISCKCHLCGQVGHKQADCLNDPIPNPCHLCAGTDHEAMDCPNIVCYRCGAFGHHSRDCTNQARQRPMVCFECGSVNHDISRCHEYSNSNDSSIFESKVMGNWVRCMNCDKTGHVMCKKIPLPARSNDK